MIKVDGGQASDWARDRKGKTMQLIVDVNWAKKHPRAAARIQVAHLLRRVRNEKTARLKRVRQDVRLK